MRTDTEYLMYDPFDGDRDVDIRCHSVSMVTTRTEHVCVSYGSSPHPIPPGTRARYESALVEGKWRSCYMCVGCLDAWLDEINPQTA